jgi:DNA-binding transcriptional regulator YiaG
VKGPKKDLNKAKALLSDIGFSIRDQDKGSVHWRDAFNIANDELPGKTLAGFRYRENLTQQQLSELTGISRRHISEYENNKNTLGKKRAKILADVLHCDYRLLL